MTDIVTIDYDHNGDGADDYVAAGDEWTNTSAVGVYCTETGTYLLPGFTYRWTGESWSLVTVDFATGVSGDGKPEPYSTKNEPKGVWDAFGVYTKGDMVETGGSSYIALYNGVTAPTTDTNAWGVLAKAGSSATVAMLSNDSQTFPCDSNGTTTSLAGGISTMSVFDGFTDDTANWGFSTFVSGCTITGTNTNSVTIATMASPTGYVDITASRVGYSPITKRFSVSKVLAGADGSNGANGTNGADGTSPAVYNIKFSNSVIVKLSTGVIAPTSLIVSSFRTQGAIINEETAVCWGVKIDSGSEVITASATTKSIDTSTVTSAIKITAYQDMAGNFPLDTQTIMLVSDGGKGASGVSATRAYANYPSSTVDPTFTPDSGKTTKSIVGNTTYPTMVTGSTPTGTWQSTPFASATKQFQMDGLYDGTNTLWNQPYLSLFKVDTLEAFTSNVGHLHSVSAGSRLTINDTFNPGTGDVDSHEFRAYSEYGLIASMGDMGKNSPNETNILNYDPVFLANTFNAYYGRNKRTRAGSESSYSNTSGFHSNVPSPEIAGAIPSQTSISGMSVTTSALGGSATAKLAVYLGRVANVSSVAGTASYSYCGFFNNTGIKAGSEGITGISTQTSLNVSFASTTEETGYCANFQDTFRGTTRNVWMCNGVYAIDAVGRARVTSGAQMVDMCNGTESLKVQGSITCSGNVTAYDGSDKRLKENITPISNPIEKLMSLSGNNFRWVDDYYEKQNQEFFKQNDVGVIAQEVLAVLPEAIHERETGFLAVDYKKLIPLLIECVKAQQAQIEGLQNDLAK